MLGIWDICKNITRKRVKRWEKGNLKFKDNRRECSDKSQQILWWIVLNIRDWNKRFKEWLESKLEWDQSMKDCMDFLSQEEWWMLKREGSRQKGDTVEMSFSEKSLGIDFKSDCYVS